MNIETKGKLIVIGETQTFPSGFIKREFVIETHADKYPQKLKFEVVKDKCAGLDKLRIGQNVTVDFDVRGSEYNGKYYANIQGWKLDKGEVKAAQKQKPNVITAPAGDWDEDESDDLPF